MVNIKINFDIDSYKTKFVDGARAYLFFAMFTFPPGIDEPVVYSNVVMSSLLSPLGYGAKDNVVPYMVKSTSIPDSTFEELIIPYPGLPYKMAGTRTYGDWTVSFNVDNEGVLLRKFHNWHDWIYEPSNNYQTGADFYMVDQNLFLLDGTGNATHKIQLVQAWPKSLGAVGLDYSSTDIATIDVSFSYQYYKVYKLDANSTQTTRLQSLINKVAGKPIGGLF